ncbi:MAG TPA: hypothetical protein VJO16_00935 [Candidatus Acidoferrum sp.]|nr:hypothetical protein [Candidatus Acidoferrum sp.]
MGRIRLAGLSLASLALLLCVTQEAAAQSSKPSAKASEGRGERDSIVRVPLPRPRPTPRGPEIFYCETPDTSCRTTQDAFPLADLRDLFIFVVWPGVTGQHIQTVQFLLPDGSVYSSQKTQFAVGGHVFYSTVVTSAPNVVAPPPPAPHLMADANKTHAEGIPSLLMKSRGDSAVLTVLPIAGTYITQRNLSGTWHVRVLLDDRVALESEFTLAPRQPARAAIERDEAEL